MYSRPSTEVIVAPCALRKKTGVPPTLLNARTGLCTPPGVMRWARSKYSRESSCESKAVCSEAIIFYDIHQAEGSTLWSALTCQRFARSRLVATTTLGPSFLKECSDKSPHSKLFPNPQLSRITRAVSNDVLGAGAFEHVPGLAQSFFELYQALLSQ